MSAIIKTLKTTTNDVEQSVYPKTVLEAVVDAETNETLDVILDNLNEKIDNIEPGSGGGTTYELSRTDDTITLTGGDGSSSEITDSSAYLSRENLLVYPYYNNTSTKDGVTFTDNNGIITATGTSTATFSGFMCRHRNDNKLVLPIGTYTLSGCPEGGSTSTYYITIGRNDSSGSWIDIGNDIGEGITFTLTEESQIGITIAIKQDVTVENLIFKPMLEVGTVAHEYQPYNLSRQKLRSDLDNINTDVNVSDKVSKSGDTMTGDLTVKANVNIPLLADNTGDTLQPIPTAGTLQKSGDYMTSETGLKTMKSFIGSYYGGTTSATNAWNSVISVRHRNGHSDGNSHGMYLRSLMNRGNADLIWNNQNAGTWENERTILDSRNYSSYALPLTGGKITGGLTVTDGFYSTGEQTVLYQDYYCFQCSDGAGKSGYWKLCTINVTGTYAGAPILFYMTSRAGAGKVAIRFGDTTDVSAYSVTSFSRESGINSCYVVKTSGTSSGSVFDIYVKKEEAYGNLTVNHLEFPKYMRDLVTITWSGAYASSVPSGYTEATAYTILNTTNYSSNIPAATQSAVGLMSAADKKKLDGIATGANKITVDSSLSSTSTNPVQNKVVNSAIATRLPLSGGDMTGSICFADGKGIVDYAKQVTVFTTSGTTVTPTSVISAKRPIYVGATNTSYVTYIRGTYVYLDSTYNPVNSKAWLTNSDQRIKTNSILLNNEDKYLTFFDNLKPRNYNYIRDEEDANKTIGFYAQEVEDALLSAGLTNKDFAGLTIIEDFEEGLGQGKDEAVYYKQFYTLSYEQFIPIVVNKIQHMEKEFNAKIEELEQKIEELTGGTE